MKGREVGKEEANRISQKIVSLHYFSGKNKHETDEVLFCSCKNLLYEDISELALDMEMSLSPSCSL